jgi:hypothetical protein
MKTFTGWQWLLIDAANQFGHDKWVFEDRIKWAEDNLNDLEALAPMADKKHLPLYLKAVQAIRKAQQGVPTGHMVGLDACCSGIQIMSVLTGCVNGARATGLVDPNRRADAYSDCTTEMQNLLGSAVNVARDDAKKALMTSFYGSQKQPELIFGEDTPELDAFYQAAMNIAPGPWELLQVLLGSWRPFSLSHDWKLPDGFDAHVKVMVKKDARIEVDELGGASFTYEYYDNEGTKKGLSNVANLTHSVDAYILRTMHRRCNYDWDLVKYQAEAIQIELLARLMGEPRTPARPQGKAGYYVDQYDRSTLVDITILPYLTEDVLPLLTTEHLSKLAEIVNGMLQHPPFPLVTVHDEFKAHPNNLDAMRQHYRNILAEIAESNLLDDLLSQIYGVPGHFQKLSTNLGSYIRNSEYALC